ncbi:hypothetical protein BDV26DRAFT_266640 [Aspergillus bertholletiae]|uniref:Uncharacterized protein n=1 Tax=Aspergillus bertholletiae TaxID=1226010 RepID=A0A5N7B1X9_9EURO|nr:hypothetical protein BDV26DRAFT_266640 [Aspergillus bertholletiae]
MLYRLLESAFIPGAITGRSGTAPSRATDLGRHHWRYNGGYVKVSRCGVNTALVSWNWN